ncbi:hypothetical protein MFFC18_17720 [Mariniblastus fucicola]|uniref:Cytochrome c domain-containing protein n=2 Tax=Mariniblastus fucicola TaxID=980251 RepID=A0A5B9PG98_9BACT|nr:hypothetical protein MFFC18_17720 [Mariniblastus fucicola]
MISSTLICIRDGLIWAGCVTLACCLSAMNPAPATAQETADSLRDVQREFNETIRPMLETHCGDCHWGDNTDADLNLEQYETLDQLLSGRKKWKKVLIRVAAKEMPPEDCDPIPDDEHAKLLAWVDQLLNSVDCTNINPGRVTIRRLNRTEYKNTIRDLTGVDYETDGNFPVDDVGYGFDNIADVLSLSPILMEKYLKAAEAITLNAVKDPARSKKVQRFVAKDFTRPRGVNIHNNVMTFPAQATATAKFGVIKRGTYRAVLVATGNQAGNEPVKMKLDVNGKQRQFFNVTKEQGDTPQTFETELRFTQTGEQEINVSFTNDFYQEAKRGEKPQDRNLHFNHLTIEGPIGAQRGQYGKLVLGEPGESKQQQRKVARKSIQVFASRAYRRPVKSDEVDRLMKLYDSAVASGDSIEKALRYPMQAVLVSPHFLYKIEQPVPVNEIRELNDFELATSLSYFLWSSMPDAVLFKLAAKGKLKDKEVFRKQVERMLKDKRAKAVVQNFATQWLQLRSLARMQPDPDMFPGVDAQLRNDMETETKLLVYDLIRRDAQVTDLLKADYTFLNERLAKHYGVEGVKGNKFQKVSSEKTDRQGILTHASILTLTSNPNRTSPVKRGKWIMENLLGEEPPPPDPDAMQLEDQPQLAGTLRQRMEQHRADPSCAVCHKVMDELGFALENYDAVGKWRVEDEVGGIDPRGELPDGTTFQGSKELQVMIRTGMRAQFVRCVAEKMLIYALGRGLEYYDECTLDKIVFELKDSDYRFSALVIAITESDPFRKRFGEGASPGDTE